MTSNMESDLWSKESNLPVQQFQRRMNASRAVCRASFGCLQSFKYERRTQDEIGVEKYGRRAENTIFKSGSADKRRHDQRTRVDRGERKRSDRGDMN